MIWDVVTKKNYKFSGITSNLFGHIFNLSMMANDLGY